MQFLKKTAIVVALMLFLTFIKGRFENSGATYSFFLTNLLTNLRLLIFLWLIAVGLLQLIRKQLSTLKATVIFFVLVSFTEMATAYLLHHPDKIPGFLLPVCKKYYYHYQCGIIQLNPNCSQYDSVLGYRLVPSKRFQYSNFEFNTPYFTNQPGMRDDDRSLDKPDIICLGDSYTMGWGVGQDENFPELLQKQTKYNVLNAGISSYGTARELLSLKNLDTSNLKYLVIQYCYNDRYENDAFIQNNYKLPVSPPEKYATQQQQHGWTTQYYPFKHCLTIAKLFRNSDTDQHSDEVADSTRIKSVEQFLKIVNKLPQKVKVIALYLPERLEQADHGFLNELQKQSSSIYPIDVLPALKKEDYYILDLHLRPGGHRKVATLIEKKIAEIKSQELHVPGQ